MNCQEVMELMQRQLDGDLDAQEENELHAHLAHCLDCVQKFERLQRLSGELAQLPKVIPPYSLVDAILPQLADIDRQAAASITEKKAVFSTNVSQIDHGQSPKLPWTRRFGSQFSWKFAGGVVAAGLILGFFAFNLKHPVLDQADGLLQPRAKSEEKSAGQQRSTAAVDPNLVQDADKKKIAGSADTKVKASNDATANSLKETSVPKASAASGSKPQASSDANLEEPKALNQSGAAKDSSATHMTPSTSEPERMKVSKSTLTNSAASPGASSKQPDEPKDANQLKTTEPTPAPIVKKWASTGDVGGMQSLTVPAGENPLKSTTGAFEAIVEDQHVVIRNSSSNEIVFASKQVWQSSDRITLVEWSKDDKLFYQVESGGSLQTILIDLIMKTEIVK
ncbi:Putative zinc-finger [Paenibacillus sp. yr247]|uniref:zf-HC2 domain-containing protein n=1 Tax=Paenibacillus sp. yr247 TaxID=1761880 RepID=UPI000885A609|nr:zf-HC2 domain-containing protein [Paenibacillus sp. yr247]SDM87242.1 Putative zinc-finger [Paenibacillus sp. yr247]